ncbi:MFS transporter [Affinibrenneria salicis]|uniref:MFS transporter n=1 Tax=Affinibrenneria salicis TaxID=2590031 RepID=A0A5J5G4K2_9GAMM|nr:MFS transporter [Affinibrenneria salicis]KAA9001991.1 MFS transporter [Affinibrenneria salicis]
MRTYRIQLPLLILFALLALALNLRSPLTAIAPVIDQLRADLAINVTMAGMLTSIPVLCFGILTPLASVLISRTGIEKAILITLAGTIIGTLLRPAGGLNTALAGTLILGASLTIGNIVCLMVIARDFSQRRNMATGLYTAALNVGTMLTSALTAPLALWAGWRSALACWAALAVLALICWGRVIQRKKRLSRQAPADRADRPALKARVNLPTDRPYSFWRRPILWYLVVAFTVHLLVYYGMTAWLPTWLTQEAGMSAARAGLIASVFQITALIGSFGVPMMASMWRVPRSLLLVMVGIFWMMTPAGMYYWPQQWLFWSLVSGVAQGGGFTAIFMLIMENARDLDDNRRFSSAVQGVGYTLASVGPLITGGLHSLTGSWAASFLLLSACSILMSAMGVCVALINRQRPA